MKTLLYALDGFGIAGSICGIICAIINDNTEAAFWAVSSTIWAIAALIKDMILENRD